MYRLEFGFRKVRWPGRTEPLYLVVVEGLGSNPLSLLTNRKVTRSRKSLWRVVETIRFIKQSYQLENIRLLKYEGLRNLVILVQHVQRAAKRIYGVPEFRFYAIADGIKQLLFGRNTGIGPLQSDPRLNLLPLSS